MTEDAALVEIVIRHDDIVAPERFTRDGLGWVPWLAPLPESEFEQRHWDGVVDPQRAKFPYFALLAREPEILAARTRTDNDIFYNDEGGLPRAERELAATTASRVNGCVFCASVHSKNATQLSGRPDDVQRLLDEGVGATIDSRWDALVAASAALTTTPVGFTAEHVARLLDAGLSDIDVADAINGAAFFNWANRLMLSLGEPHVPTRGRKG